MASLWKRLTLSTKTHLSSNNGAEPEKRTRKQSARSRKQSASPRMSLAQIFPNLYDNPSDDKENTLAADTDLKCEEAVNYPVYDAKNPEHNTDYHPSARRSRSMSLLREKIQKGKASLRSKSPSPTRMLRSSRMALNEFANSVKSTAAGISPLTSSALRDISPAGRDSDKSLKSVHWRSSESTQGDENIRKGTSPTLPNYDYSEHFLGSKILLTSMPPPKLIFPTIAKEELAVTAAEEVQTIAAEKLPLAAAEELPFAAAEELPFAAVEDLATIGIGQLAPVAIERPSPVAVNETSPVAVEKFASVTVEEISPVDVENLPTVAAKELPAVIVEDTDADANMTNSSSPLEDPFADPSDESMSIVDESEYSQEACQELLTVEIGRVRTPSPAGICLLESPMPQKFS